MKIDADQCAHREYWTELINCDQDHDKPMVKLDDNNLQIIPFGKLIRNTYLDELPQLLNVLRGEMSMVGPRPPIPYEVEEYIRWHNGRFDIVPGMTGLWQVSGKNRLTFKEMVRLDIRYSRNLSFYSDIKILMKTPFVIISELIDYPKRDMISTILPNRK
jgi:lipopolysaccharide/colanic/teichoic acid biosynthesis glycosyltransferase